MVLPRGRVSHDCGMTLVQQAFTELTDLAWPRRCAVCAIAGSSLCDECFADIVVTPKRTHIGGLAVWSCTPFEGSIRELITAHKDRGRSDVTWLLRRLMRYAIAQALADSSDQSSASVVVPIPSSTSSRRERGRSPLTELTPAISDGHVRRVQALQHTRAVADQSRLSKQARERNLAGAFGVRPSMLSRVRGCTVLLVDDVVTSGATLNAAAAALRAANVQHVVAATIAHTPRQKFP